MRIHGASRGDGNHPSGTALLTTLTLVSLAVILVFAYFHRARMALSTTEDNDREIKAKDVAETAVNLVIAQIRSATTVAASGWASQPGVIRVWGEDGRFEKGYKLYSDETMVERDERALVERDFSEMGNNWKQRDWIYTDLNAPTQQGTEWVFPILDPAAKEVHEIEGFDFDNQRIGGGSKLNPLPMPVKWIYQLEDGTLGLLNSGRRFVATRGAVTPTRDNQIVARFAFWADDETCKLNVNVNAGGMAASPQFAGGDLDRHFQRYLPSHNEWQRYPGHPATTSLAPVFAPGDRELVLPLGRDRVKSLYDLVPRVAHGGSQSGTRLPNLDSEGPNGLVADRDRLLPSLDDIILRPNRELAEFPDGVAEGSEDVFLRRARFFLTSDSGSPETTFSGLPRVSIWPTYFGEGGAAKARRTTQDEWLRVCAEVGLGSNGEPLGYHFQRRNADSATEDFDGILRNRELFAYLYRLTSEAMPGIGKSLATKYSKDERLQILTEIFDYIRCTNLHDDNLFGEDWRAAYSDADQNTREHLPFTNGRIDYTQWAWAFGSTKYYRFSNGGKVHKGAGQVTPIRIKHDGVDSQGIGRFHTMQEMGVLVIACAEGGDGTGGGGSRMVGRGQSLNDPELVDRECFSNFPPLPLSVDADKESTWPEWLKQLKMDSPDLVEIAFAPENWNWQLAWLDPGYAAAMPEGKFDRSFLHDAEVTRLSAGETLVQGGLIWNMVCPSMGWAAINPDMVVDLDVDGMNFQAAGGEAVSIGWKQQLKFGDGGPGATAWRGNRSTGALRDGVFGGIKNVEFFLSAGERLPGLIRFEKISHSEASPADVDHIPGGVSLSGRSSSVDRNFAEVEPWNQNYFISRPFKINGKVEFSGGKVGVRIYAAGPDSGNEGSAAQLEKSLLVQEMEIPFPKFSVDGPELEKGTATEFKERVGPMSYWSLSWDGANPVFASVGRLAMVNGDHGYFHRSKDVVQSVVVDHADVRYLSTKPKVTEADGLFQPLQNYGERRQAFAFQSARGARLRPEGERGYPGSDRLVPSLRYYSNKAPYPMATANPAAVQRYGDFDSGPGLTMDGPWINRPNDGNGHMLVNRSHYEPWLEDNWYSQRWFWGRGWGEGSQSLGYQGFSYMGGQHAHPSYYTPNRIINSPGMFGSLPVGTTSDQPWRTLLFRPDVSGGLYKGHPGAGKGSRPADHLLLDLFWMPIIEPFSLSEAYATRGKVNLNYQILPFRHVRRDTALRGVLQSETQLCIPNKWSKDYKTGVGRGRGYHWLYRPFDGTLQRKSLRALFVADDTLEQFEERFNDPAEPTLFRTASEICEVHLIPESISEAMGGDHPIDSYTPTVEQMANGKYWSDHALVGDNARETPYSNIYSRVTTRSNTYTVHCKAQVLKQGRRQDGEDYATWDTEHDSVVAEESNATRIERYLDVTDSAIPDYATEPDAPSLDSFYRYRVVQRRGAL